MLARGSRAATHAVLRRGYRTDPITRLQLDILASEAGQDGVPEPRQAVTKSPEAIRGESMRGDVQLPLELQQVVEKAIEAAESKQQIRQYALDLYAHMRATTGLQQRDKAAGLRPAKAATTPTYDGPTSLAYLAGLMPSVFGSTLHALTSTRDRLKLARLDDTQQEWIPERIIDFGCGTASAAWAFDLVWPETTSKEYIGLDSSRSMVELASAVVGALPNRVVEDGRGQLTKSTIEAKVHQLVLPASRQSMAKLHVSPSNRVTVDGISRRKRTVAIAAFSLSDAKSREKRKELVRSMWESGSDVIVIVDRGTPAGSRAVIEAREQLLMFGKRSVAKANEFGVDETEPIPGSHVLAPCPHDGKCPLHHTTKSFCHFSQRVRSPAFLRQTKHTTRGEDDAKFSYVVIRRGSRPGTEAQNAVVDSEDGTTLDSKATSGPGPTVDHYSNEMSWPRLVAPPLKRSGHVVLEVCTASGQLERHTIPKSQGRQPYYDARKVAWGDTFPHRPKNGPQPAPAMLNHPFEWPIEDKFGPGRSKLRQKKADRKVLDDGSGVQEFEMDFDEDGKLRVVS
ncbi:37S ribosomal protein S22 [Microbotryomycetes sp. JL221]|nr:37S ribosomal protein S22 [Microbotryomycetes sp. JL221]